MATQATTSTSPAPQEPVGETLASLSSNRDTGLATAEADDRLRTQGPNEVPAQRSHPVLRFAKKFWGLSAWMIELIAALSFVLHKRADFWVALSLLVANALLSFLQEQRASAAVQALRSKLQVTARVLRDANWQSVPARRLVTGDVVRVRAGDFVPADVQLFDGSLRIDQSALTGESQEVAKAADAALYAGSTVRDGEATGVVVATGARTYFGRTTELVEGTHPKLHVFRRRSSPPLATRRSPRAVLPRSLAPPSAALGVSARAKHDDGEWQSSSSSRWTRIVGS